MRQEAVSSRSQLRVKRQVAAGREHTEWTEDDEAMLREVFQNSLEPREAVKQAAEHFPGEGGLFAI